MTDMRKHWTRVAAWTAAAVAMGVTGAAVWVGGVEKLPWFWGLGAALSMLGTLIWGVAVLRDERAGQWHGTARGVLLLLGVTLLVHGLHQGMAKGNWSPLAGLPLLAVIVGGLTRHKAGAGETRKGE